MKNIKRIIAMLLAICLLLTLIGCSNSGTMETGDSSDNEEVVSEDEMSEEETALVSTIRHDSFVYATSREPSSLDPAAYQVV